MLLNNTSDTVRKVSPYILHVLSVFLSTLCIGTWVEGRLFYLVGVLTGTVGEGGVGSLHW